MPAPDFLSDVPPPWPLPITSIQEGKLLLAMGLPDAEVSQIEGLQIGRTPVDGASTGPRLSEEQLSSRAIVRLAANPPPEVGCLQKRTAMRMLRPFPHGLRFSGSNMSPLPGWLAGAQSIALNFSHCDLQAQLHFALFHGSGGYVLKPKEMREMYTPGVAGTKDGGAECAPHQKEDAYWPPPRERLHRTTIEILSLHNLPKRGERRPRLDGQHEASHKYHPELSGTYVPPDNSEPSSPAVSIALHPIGGFCAVSKTLPLPQTVETQLVTKAVEGNGLNAAFSQVVNCIAAEPHATILRVSVVDSNGQELAFETAVLGRLRHGYRVLQLRGMLGTRIELCYLFVKISFGSEPNLWATPRHIRIQSSMNGGRSTSWHDTLDHHVSQRVRAATQVECAPLSVLSSNVRSLTPTVMPTGTAASRRNREAQAAQHPS